MDGRLVFRADSLVALQRSVGNQAAIAALQRQVHPRSSSAQAQRVAPGERLIRRLLAEGDTGTQELITRELARHDVGIGPPAPWIEISLPQVPTPIRVPGEQLRPLLDLADRLMAPPGSGHPPVQATGPRALLQQAAASAELAAEVLRNPAVPGRARTALLEAFRFLTSSMESVQAQLLAGGLELPAAPSAAPVDTQQANTGVIGVAGPLVSTAAILQSLRNAAATAGRAVPLGGEAAAVAARANVIALFWSFTSFPLPGQWAEQHAAEEFGRLEAGTRLVMAQVAAAAAAVPTAAALARTSSPSCPPYDREAAIARVRQYYTTYLPRLMVARYPAASTRPSVNQVQDFCYGSNVAEISVLDRTGCVLATASGTYFGLGDVHSEVKALAILTVQCSAIGPARARGGRVMVTTTKEPCAGMCAPAIQLFARLFGLRPWSNVRNSDDYALLNKFQLTFRDGYRYRNRVVDEINQRWPAPTPTATPAP